MIKESTRYSMFDLMFDSWCNTPGETTLTKATIAISHRLSYKAWSNMMELIYGLPVVLG